MSAADPQWTFPFTGLKPAQFRRLVRLVAQRDEDRIADGYQGNPEMMMPYRKPSNGQPLPQ